MAIAVSEAGALKVAAAIDRQTVVLTTQLGALNLFLNTNYSIVAAEGLVGTPAKAQRILAQNSTDILIVLSNMLAQQQLMVASIDVMQTALAGVSSQVAAGVTTAQLATADQIKANKFQQQTTNASLKRADLPETEVTDESFLESSKKLVDDTLTFKSQIGISSLVERQITSAIDWTVTSAGNFVQASFVGQAVQNSKITQRIKAFFITAKETKTETLKATIAVSANARGKLLVDPAPKGDAGVLLGGD
jgi:hypothetical protein